MQLLTRLGFDTGFEPGEEPYSKLLRAGCEWEVHWDFDEDPLHVIKERIVSQPRVLKSPEWGLCLKRLMMNELIEVDHVLLPVRDLDASARSRLDVGLDWMASEDLKGDAKALDQAQILAMALGRAIEACLLFQIPCTIMQFPALVMSADYCYAKLTLMRAFAGIDRETFDKEFQCLSNPAQIKWR